MLNAYIDESERKVAGRPVDFTMGAVLASDAIWRAVNAEWQTILNDNSRRMFHATRDRTDEMVMARVYRYVDRHSDMFFFGVRQAAENTRGAFKRGYGANVMNMIKLIEQRARFIGDDVRLVFAVHDGFRGQRIASYLAQISVSLPRLKLWVTARPQDCNPLQVGDLAAYAITSKIGGDDAIFSRLNHRHSFHFPELS